VTAGLRTCDRYCALSGAAVCVDTALSGVALGMDIAL